MSSIVPGFEYDIFISYRQKDNRGDRWVTEFVNALKSELDATFKEDISIYFDENPHDGLLSTHDVDESLKEKLKCLVLIPIISQTYCDPKSFAWKNEFLAFKKLASEDLFGLKVKLQNGNVANRILPVRIHDLDETDISVIEGEIGPLRSVDFIFKSAGVNRPLLAHEEFPQNNIHRTQYRDQTNKVANSVKEILTNIRGYSQTSSHKSTANLNTEPTDRGTRKKKPLVIAIAAILFVGIAFLVFFQRDRNAIIDEERSLAVLSFVDLSPNKDHEWFSDGLTDEILNSVASVADFKVVSRTSSSSFKGKNLPIQKIADSLHVTYIVEGTVRKDDNKLRISARLMHAKDGFQIWSEKYDKELKDVFEIQTNVASQVARALSIAMAPRANQTTNLDALQYYMKGRSHFGLLSKEEIKESMAFFTQSIALDPNYPLAYAGLADCYGLAGYFGYSDISPYKEAMTKSKELALKALEINPSLAEAYTSLGYVLRTYEWDWKGAEAAYRKAIKLNPNYDLAHDHLGMLLTALGRFEEGILELKRALELDPLSYFHAIDLVRAHRYAGQTTESISIIKQASLAGIKSKPLPGMLSDLYTEVGLYDSAIAQFKKTDFKPRPQDERTYQSLKAPDAQKRIDLMNKIILQKHLSSPQSNLQTAAAYMSVRDIDSALVYLRHAMDEREGGIVYINVEPLFRPLHADVRFDAIVRKMGLKP